MTDEVGTRVVRNYLLSAVRLAVGQGVAAAAFLVLSHALTTSEYAVYAGFAVAAPALYFLTSRPLAWVFIRRTDTVADQELSAAATMIFLVSFGAVVTLLATTATAAWTSPWLYASLAVWGATLGASFPAYVQLSRALRTVWASMIEFSDRVVFQVATVVLVLAGATVTQSVSVALAASGSLALAVALAASRFIPRPVRPTLIRGPLREAIAPGIALGLSLAIDSSMIPLVGLAAGQVQAGYFGWSFSIYLLPLAFVLMAGDTLFPAYSRVQPEQVRLVVERTSRLVLLMASSLCVGLACALPSLMAVAFPSRWGDAIPVATVLLATVMVQAWMHMLGTYWNARVSLAQFARWQGAAAGATWIVGLAAAIAWGAVGGALGFLCGRVVLAVLLLVHGRRQLGVRLGFDGARILASGGLAYVLVKELNRRTQDGWTELVSALLLGGGAALVVAMVLVPATRQDLRASLSLLRGRAPLDRAPR